MRTLSKPQKQKNQSQQKEKKEGKAVNKKVTKTVFQTPFRYKMYTLVHKAKLFLWRTKVIFQKS